MLKKIDKAASYLAQNLKALRCPICHNGFNIDKYALVCTSGHTYNLNKKGSINFLTTKADTTHYTRKMFEPRRKLIQAGMYAPVLAEIEKLVSDGNLLDVGTGEGSFLNQLAVKGGKFGFDIAKDGIQMASEYSELAAFFSLADLTNLPFADQSMTTVLNIFTPSNYKEFKRVLASSGQVIKVIPDRFYLQELRQAFGMKVAYDNQEVVDKFIDNFPNYSQTTVHYEFELPHHLQQDFLSMSPLEWQVSEQEKREVAKHPPQVATVHVQILQGKKS